MNTRNRFWNKVRYLHKLLEMPSIRSDTRIQTPVRWFPDVIEDIRIALGLLDMFFILFVPSFVLFRFLTSPLIFWCHSRTLLSIFMLSCFSYDISATLICHSCNFVLLAIMGDTGIAFLSQITPTNRIHRTIPPSVFRAIPQSINTKRK